MMDPRRLGRSGLEVSPLGLGTARMAGLGWNEETVPSNVTQAKGEAVRQIQAAVDAGVTLFDTADNYGQGLSEEILGEALKGRRESVVVVTKFGEDPMPEEDDPWSLEAGIVERKCEASLRRLDAECLDVYLLHRRDYPLELAPELINTLEDLVRRGKIRYYGWSTDDVERARLIAQGEHCTAIEHRLNVLIDNPDLLDLCREENLASLNRIPLLLGVLTGRWTRSTRLEQDDRRAQWFEDEGFLKLLDRASRLNSYLTCDGRSTVQGALGWLWAHSPLTIPVPGFRDTQQMEELVQAMQYGPLPMDEMQAIADCERSANG